MDSSGVLPDHILSQIEMIDPSRAPLSPAPKKLPGKGKGKIDKGKRPVPPQLPDPGCPCPALRKQVVAGLFLSSPAPPAPVVVHLVDLVFEVGVVWLVSWLVDRARRKEVAKRGGEDVSTAERETVGFFCFGTV